MRKMVLMQCIVCHKNSRVKNGWQCVGFDCHKDIDCCGPIMDCLAFVFISHSPAQILCEASTGEFSTLLSTPPKPCAFLGLWRRRGL